MNFIQKHFLLILLLCFSSTGLFAQVPANINSGNPNFAFPQFLEYNGGALKNLGSYDHNMVGVPHAELELRIREAYAILCNDMTYTGDVVAGVKYIYPTAPQHCTCVEGDGYYLLAAAYMGDKATFDGYYMWAHDRGFTKTVRFIDGIMNAPTYRFNNGLSGAGNPGSPTGTYGSASGNGAATDGDVDLAMALLVAYKQWGTSGIVPPATGVEIDYKKEALRYIHAMVDTIADPLSSNPSQWDSGDIGFDGYVKGGDTWNELTGWASAGFGGKTVQYKGPQTEHMDYNAPAYFKSFAQFFTTEAQSVFSISQLQRAEASGDWLMGQMAAQGLVGFAGWVDMSSGTPVFSAQDLGEDFRTPWRTNLSYVWNGNPTTSWNPTTHQVVAGGNTYEYNAALNSVAFFNNPQAKGNPSISLAGVPIEYCGPVTVKQQHLPDGTGGNGFRLSWPQATFSPAAVSAQDFTLMGKMYRQCEITWDGNTDVGQQYLASKPRYFHEWFRLLGMMILSGNYHDPLDMNPVANMKVYKDVNKTYAFVGDTITYTISYRNYGKPDATTVQIVDNLPAGLKYLSSSVAASVGGSSVTFNVGTVKGTNIGLPANLAQTTGSITMKAIVQSGATGRLCNTASITCSNGTGWTSNEYPNNVTEVMQRNCVDILVDNALTLTKTASKGLVQVGDTLSYTLVVKDKSVGFLNGGREGVQVAFGHQGLPTSASEVKLNFRIYHGAEESYINYQNYRLSYFLNKAGPPNWQIGTPLSTNEGFGGQIPTIAQQNLTPGVGYNHRFFITFPNQIATITPYLLNYYSNTPYIHRGALMPARIEMRVYDPANGLWNWTNDWSSDPNILVASGDAYFPVGDDWTDPLNPGIPVTKIHPDACTNVSYVTKKVLVEEWDGYTWRRAYGNAPVSGRQLANVKVTDTLPAGVVFGGFFPGYPVGTVSGNVITWPTIANMNINDSVAYRFWVTVKPAAYFGCPAAPTPATIVNKAGAKADKERTVFASATTNVSCSAVVVTSPSMTKTADKTSYAVGDNIIYTITHKNLSGSIVSGATAAADWNDVKGNGKLTVNAAGTIDLNASWTDKIMTYKYSHGTDGVVKGSLTPSQYQEIYAVVLRQNGNKWVEVRFKVTNSNVEISVYNFGITAAGTYTQIGATQTIPYSNIPGKFDFQIALSGSQLNFWLVNPGVLMSSTPQLIFTGIPVQAGYAGVRSNNGTSGPILENWYTNLDSEFNFQMTDPLLSNLSFVSAASATYNAATYTASNVAGVVTWQPIPGPILKNDQVTYTWTAKLTSCLNPTITNVAYGKVLGITPDLAATNTVACAGTSTCSKPTVVTITSPAAATLSLCAGTAQTLAGTVTVTAAAQNTNFTYSWIKAGTATPLQTATIALTANTPKTVPNYTGIAGIAGDAGIYILRVEDGNTGNALCFTDDTLTVTINSKPTISSVGTGTICSGLAQSYTITSAVPSTYSWTRTAVAGITNAGVTAQTTNPITEALTNSTTAAVTVTYVITPTSTTGTCAGTPFNYVVTVNPTPVIISPSTGIVCSGIAQGYAITSSVPSGYIWSRAAVTGITNAAITNQTAGTITESLINNKIPVGAVTVTYIITPTSTTGACAGAPTNYTVTVNPTPAITSAATGTICTGVAQNYAITGSIPSSYSWTRTAVAGVTTAAGSGITSPITETLDLASGATASVNVTYIITPTSTTGTCAGAPFNYVVTVNPKPVITSVAAGIVCSGVAQSYAITSNVVSTYSWTRAAVTGITTSANTGTTSPITEILTNSTAAAVTVTYVITPTGGCAGTPFNYAVTVNPSPQITSSATGTICSGIAQSYAIISNASSTYKWSRAAMAGITNTAVTNQTAATISESLTNSTSSAVDVVYTITPIATTGTCAGMPFNYTVTINPVPVISSSSGSVCSGSAQNYAITSNVASTYSWSRAAVTGITNGAATAQTSTPITETLTNSTAGAINVTYVITPTSTAGTCVGTAFNYVVTVNPAPAITSAATGTTCTGVALNYLITSDVASTYSWTRASVTGINGGAPNSGTSNPITETLTGAGTVTYVITPTSTAGACADTPFTYTVSVGTSVPPGITLTVSPSSTICDGSGVVFTATPDNEGTSPIYKWYVNGSLAGVVGTTYLTSVLSDGDEVQVYLTSNSPCASTPTVSSNLIKVTVTPKVTPTISITADKTSICADETVTFTAAVTNEGGGSNPNPTYKWYGNGILIAGETNSTYQTTGSNLVNPVTAELTTGLTCVTVKKVASSPVSVPVNTVIAPTVSITSDVPNICSGHPVIFTATATNAGSTPMYQWYIGTTPQGAASTSATFSTISLTDPAGPPATPGSNEVHVEVTSSASCGSAAAVSSNTVTITVNAGVLPGSIGTGSSFCSGTSSTTGITEVTAATGITSAAAYTWEQSTGSPASWNPATGTPTNGGKGFTPGGTYSTDISYRRTVTDNTLPLGCQSATTNAITYTVVPLPTITSAPGGTICSGASQNYVITSDIGSGYTWSRAAISGVNSNAAGSGTSSPITESLVNNTTSPVDVVYSIVAKSLVGSCTGTAFTYTVTVNPTPHITSPASDVICSGAMQNYTITSDIGAIYTWSRAAVADITDAGVTNQTSNPITEALSNSTTSDVLVTYIITPTSTGSSCVGQSTTYVVTVAGVSTPTVTISTPSTSICVGRPVTFTATGGSSVNYQWYQSSISNPAGIPVGTNSPTYITNTLASNTDQVWVTATSAGNCGSSGIPSNNVSVIVKQIPAPGISDLVKDICSAEGGYTFTGINTSPGSTYQWQYNARDIAGATDQSYFATKDGSYTLAESNGTCTNVSDPATLNIVESPVAYAGSDLYVTEGTFVQLQAGGGTTGTAYAWTPATGLTSTTVNNPSFKADNTITYIVTLTNTGGATNIQCVDHSDVTITVVKPIVVPNVITVNGDGSNDTWNILHIEGYPNATFEIYNRWGNLVWKSTGYPKQWDGTNFRNGEVLPDGTYFYIINLHSQIFTEPYTGWIQIVK